MVSVEGSGGGEERIRPFLRWAGSKRLLLHHILPHVPVEFGRYYEPFLGSGSLFFSLRPKLATIGDSCADLIEAYLAVRAAPRLVARRANGFGIDSETYYAIRSARSSNPRTRAAEFIYLNHTCFNGLYRVNQKGEFNVPWGAPKSNFIASEANLVACSALLSQPGIRIASADFEETLKGVRRGDLVYLDPPYVTSHNNNGFVDYNRLLFSWEDQVRLSRIAERLRLRGAHVMVSNAMHERVLGLYPNFRVQEIARQSTLAGNMASRRAVSEALLIS